MSKIFVMIKPEVLEHNHCTAFTINGTCTAFAIIDELLDRVVGMVKCLKQVTVTKELIEAHYAEHAGKDFFAGLTERFIGKDVLVFELHSVHSCPDNIWIPGVRDAIGPTNPTSAAALDTIRGEWGWVEDSTTGAIYTNRGNCGQVDPNGVIYNVIHASDSPEAVEREIAIWYGK